MVLKQGCFHGKQEATCGACWLQERPPQMPASTAPYCASQEVRDLQGLWNHSGMPRVCACQRSVSTTCTSACSCRVKPGVCRCGLELSSFCQAGWPGTGGWAGVERPSVIPAPQSACKMWSAPGGRYAIFLESFPLEFCMLHCFHVIISIPLAYSYAVLSSTL